MIDQFNMAKIYCCHTCPDHSTFSWVNMIGRIHINKCNIVAGKITLEGTLAERLDQLDKRESELLEELEKQKGVLKRVKEDRQHYRQKCDEKS